MNTSHPLRTRAAVAMGLAMLLVCAAAARADAPLLDVPVSCPPEIGCVIQKYVDQDRGPGYRDYACGRLSSPGHAGTDIRVPNLVAMRKGVAVIAAADGRVVSARDGVKDVGVREIDLAHLEGREGGNLVLIDHGGGWETFYAHLREGSLTVAPGDRVARGQRLGQIGMSGKAEFPHVEFGVLYRKRPIDPFVGPGGMSGCGMTERTLWTRRALAELRYIATGPLSAGFAGEIPVANLTRNGAYAAPVLGREAPVLVYWVDLFGVQEGDTASSRIVAPDGRVIAERADRVASDFAQWFRYIGKRRGEAPWPPGRYQGEFELYRDGNADPVVRITRGILVRGREERD